MGKRRSWDGHYSQQKFQRTRKRPLHIEQFCAVLSTMNSSQEKIFFPGNNTGNYFKILKQLRLVHHCQKKQTKKRAGNAIVKLNTDVNWKLEKSTKLKNLEGTNGTLSPEHHKTASPMKSVNSSTPFPMLLVIE